MRADVEGENPAHVDVGVGDRSSPPQNVGREQFRRLARHRLNTLRVPCHHDVRQQRQGSRDRGELLGRAAALRADAAIVDGALKAVHGLTLIEQVEDPRAE
jgi:hypothetical protein